MERIYDFIISCQYKYHKPKNEIEKSLGLAHTTYYRRLENPFNFTLEEIMLLFDTVPLTEEEKASFWKEVRKEWEEKHLK